MLGALADWLLDPSGLTPHGFCLLWEPGLIWTHAVSDSVIAAAYFTIPAALLVVVRRRRDLMFRPLFWLFAAFILLCGTEHATEVLTLWVPAYGLQGAIKAATAVASTITALVLWRLLPRALALPSPAQFRAANAALRDSELRYRNSFDHSPVPIYTLDGAGTITSVSESWLRLLGYEMTEVIGRSIRAFTPGAWVQADVDRLKAEGEIRDLERQFVCKDGRLVETLISARLERPGETDWVVCVLIDISARREAEKALRASEERFHQAQKMEAVGHLTGGMAHDVNNMLQGIAGGLDLIELRLAQGHTNEVGQYLDIARQSMDRAAGLTHRMLAFARRQALSPRDILPASLIRGMEDLIGRSLGPEIRLVLELDGGAWHARCDANQLESALLNLAINARDAMDGGGTLRISLADRHLSGGLRDAPELATGDYVEISVSDTGAGMTPDIVARAFEPFFTTKPTGRGTGLGLSQIYGFVRQSGGAVLLDSVPNQGTTIRLYLPRHIALEFPPGKVPPARPVTAEAVGGTVLLVEDEDKVRAVIADMLTDLGCDVLEAKDGPSGLAIVQSGARLDLLLTDVGLPGLNGRQLADAARAQQAGLPVLLITGYAGSALDDSGLAEGMEVIRKPFRLHELAARVSAILKGQLVG